MATIDLRHLVQKEFDTIEIIGSDDKLEYSLPVRKTISMSLLLQQYMTEFNATRDVKNYTVFDSIELSYLTITAWIRAYYPDLSIEWVKKNISEDLFPELMKYANDMFFPKVTETGKPKKNPKKSRS